MQKIKVKTGESNYRNIHICNLCGYKTTSVFALIHHEKRLHSITISLPKLFNCRSSIPNIYKCKKCNLFETHLRVHLNEHVKVAHKIDEEIEVNRVFITTHTLTSYGCKNCSFQTYSQLIWLKHMKDKSYRENCITTSKKLFQRGHIIFENISCFEGEQCKYKTNEDTKWFECKQCSHKAKRKANLQKHELGKHVAYEDIAWFKCGQCSYKTKYESDLRAHILVRHRVDDITWFHCGQCSYKAKQNFMLKRHLVSKHAAPDNIKCFKCGRCSYKTKMPWNLKRHLVAKHKWGLIDPKSS